MNRVIVTGSTGFIGSNLVPQLSFNYKITAVNRIITHSNGQENQAISYDDFWENNVHAKHYVHLAGKAHDLINTPDESEYFKINTELSMKLFDCFLKDNKAQTFVFISSVKAVTDEVRRELTEEHDPDPVTAYGRSKLKAEQYILNKLPNDKTVVILRPCMIYGPGYKGNLNLLYGIISKGFPWPLGSYDNLRSFLSIDNLCFVIKEILEGKVQTGVYNVADDWALSTTELVSIISEVTNNKTRIWDVPKPIIQMIAKVGNILPLPLNEERLGKLTENYLVSNKKIKKALGIDKMPISAKEGIINTLQNIEAR